MKYINTNIQEAQGTPSKMNSNRYIPRHIIITFFKTKEKKIYWNQQERSNSLHASDLQLDCLQIFHQSLWRLEGSELIYSKC